jgi:O-antigen/teichoic acid export membrane protein
MAETTSVYQSGVAPAGTGTGPPPRPPRRLRANLVSALIGNAGYGACQLAMISVLARLTDTAQVSRFVLALAVTAPVFGVTTLKLRQIQATDVRTQFSFGHYLALRLVAVALATVALIGVALTVPTGAGAAVLIAVTLTKAAEAVLDICYGAMQQCEQLQYVARSMLIRGVGGLALFAAVIAATRRIEYAAFALTAFALARVAVDAQRVRRLGFDSRPLFERRVLARLTVLAIPLGLAMSASSLLVNVPRYFLSGTGETGEVGIYAALAYLLTGGTAVVAALAASVSPRLAGYHANGQPQAFRRLLAQSIALGGGIGVAGLLVAAVLGRHLLALLYGPGYAVHADVLVLLMVTATLAYSSAFVGTGLDAVRAFSIQLPIQLVALAAVVVAAALLVPRYGLLGAAVAELIAAGVKAVQYVVVYARVVRRALSPGRGPVAASPGIPGARVAGSVPAAGPVPPPAPGRHRAAPGRPARSARSG